MARQSVETGVGTSYSDWIELLPGTRYADASLVDPSTDTPVAGTIEWEFPTLSDGVYQGKEDKVSAGVGASSSREFPNGTKALRKTGADTARVRAKADAGSGYELRLEEG